MEGRNIAWNVLLRYQLECWVADGAERCAVVVVVVAAGSAVAAGCNVERFLRDEDNVHVNRGAGKRREARDK